MEAQERLEGVEGERGENEHGIKSDILLSDWQRTVEFLRKINKDCLGHIACIENNTNKDIILAAALPLN